ncbi:MAG: ATP-binding protein [Stomatobaculum sp.]|nr:ATP-binding protein [Stomatobaculum sp.]
MRLTYDVPGDDFTRAGEASGDVKKKMKKLGFPSNIVRRVAIALYEGEINMVIHANGGKITVDISSSEIDLVLADTGPGIPDVEKAMQDGWSTASAEVRNLGFGAGMGLPNMKNNSDEFEIETEVGVGTTVRMKIYTRRP